MDHSQARISGTIDAQFKIETVRTLHGPGFMTLPNLVVVADSGDPRLNEWIARRAMTCRQKRVNRKA